MTLTSARFSRRPDPSDQPLHWTRRIYRRANAVVSPIAFSMTLDDHEVIDRALRPAPGDRVVCLASAGDTPLNLLTHDVAEVVAVDISWPQVHLTRLKQAGARVLDLADYRRLIGADAVEDVLSIYHRVRPHLEWSTRDFWDTHRDLLQRGVMWQGSVQRLSSLWARPVRWRLALRHGRQRIRDNPYLAPLLLGRLPDEPYLPPYYTQDGYPAVAERADRLSVVAGDIRDVLSRREPRSVDAFALSNLVDWLPRRAVPGLLAEVARVAAPGARVLLCGHRRECRVPDELARHLVPDDALAAELLRMDRVGYFRRITVLRVVDGARP